MESDDEEDVDGEDGEAKEKKKQKKEFKIKDEKDADFQEAFDDDEGLVEELEEAVGNPPPT